jgi:hypothetical protein
MSRFSTAIRLIRVPTCGVAALLALGFLVFADTACCEDAWPGLWTNPDDPDLPAEASIQGEYLGQIAGDQIAGGQGNGGGGDLGAQLICLGPGAFQAVLYPGGLPGKGWDGQQRILLDGRMQGESVAFTAAEGNRKYLAKDPAGFSATREFPPPGQSAYRASIQGAVMQGTTDQGQAFTLKRIVRTSPSMGAKPPENAVVLFDGSGTEHFRGGRLDEATGWLNTDGRDIFTKDRFQNYTMHLEFLLPFRPDARGQGRGNSGFYQVDHYEVQILDSFGLEGVDNECGGVYKSAGPAVNMCLPPLTWQTYDVDFTNAVRDENGQKVKNALLTVRLNGVLIHDQLDIPAPTGGHRGDPEGTPGPIKLQGHGNPVQFRNLWIVERP